MIDIHSHIIPAVDDGSPSLEESLVMLKMAEADGVKAMVATPHMFSQVSKIKDIEQLRHQFWCIAMHLAQTGLLSSHSGVHPSISYRDYSSDRYLQMECGRYHWDDSTLHICLESFQETEHHSG